MKSPIPGINSTFPRSSVETLLRNYSRTSVFSIVTVSVVISYLLYQEQIVVSSRNELYDVRQDQIVSDREVFIDDDLFFRYWNESVFFFFFCLCLCFLLSLFIFVYQSTCCPTSIFLFVVSSRKRQICPLPTFLCNIYTSEMYGVFTTCRTCFVSRFLYDGMKSILWVKPTPLYTSLLFFDFRLVKGLYRQSDYRLVTPNLTPIDSIVLLNYGLKFSFQHFVVKIRRDSIRDYRSGFLSYCLTQLKCKVFTRVVEE